MELFAFDETIARGFEASRTSVESGSVSGAQNSIAAASLVFAHSMADGALQELCIVASEFDLAFWGATVEERTFSLKTILRRGGDDLARSSIRDKIGTMSLPSKMRHLLKNAGRHGKVEYPQFKYDKKRLEELDEIRHRIIHREGIMLEILDRDSPEFFFNLTVYAGLVTSSMLGLDITYPEFYLEWFRHLAELA